MQFYTGNTFYDTLLLLGFVFAFLILAASFFGTAQYGGKFGGEKRKGIKLGSKSGWILMEIPGLIVFPLVFFAGSNAMNPVPLLLLKVSAIIAVNT